MKVFVSLFILMFSGAAQANWTKVYEERLRPNTFLIYGDGLCSGSLIEPQLLLTAAHCVRSLAFVAVTPDADKPEWRWGMVTSLDRRRDLAVVFLPVAYHTPGPLQLRPREAEIKVGEEVATLGHPMAFQGGLTRFGVFNDLAFTFTRGIVSKVNPKSQNVLADFSVSPGNSGGPVVDTQGRLVGVVSRKLAGSLAGDLGMISSGEALYKTVDEQRAALKTQTLKPLPWWKASPHLDIGLGLYGNQWPEQKRESANGFVNLEYSFAQRFYAAYEWPWFFSTSRYDYNRWRAGYKHPLYLSYVDRMRIGGGWVWENVDYQTDTGARLGRQFNGPELVVSWNRLPVEFRYMFLTGQGERADAWILAIGLGRGLRF